MQGRQRREDVGDTAPNILVGWDALRRIPPFKAIVMMGKEGNSVAVLKNQPKCGIECSKSSAITKH